MKLGAVWEAWCRFVQLGIIWLRSVQIGAGWSDWFRLVQEGADLRRLVQVGAGRSRFGLSWCRLVQVVA